MERKMRRGLDQGVFAPSTLLKADDIVHSLFLVNNRSAVEERCSERHDALCDCYDPRPRKLPAGLEKLGLPPRAPARPPPKLPLPPLPPLAPLSPNVPRPLGAPLPAPRLPPLPPRIGPPLEVPPALLGFAAPATPLVCYQKLHQFTNQAGV